MAEESKISWTDNTFNPWMGCVKVSAGCANCYAEQLVTGRMGRDVWGADKQRQVTSAQNWHNPVKWNRKALKEGRRVKVFCASLCDVFEDHEVANNNRPMLFALIRDTPHLDWLLLTKRPERLRACLPYDWGQGWPNVWLGTSIEDNAVIGRADFLRQVPAVVRFISYEPAIGPVDELELDGIDWLICGGESGSNFRELDPQWARDIRDRCDAADVAFFFKQLSGFRPGHGELDGSKPQAFPKPRAV